MEIFSQNLENEKNLVCVLCRAERMPRETATAKYLWQNESPGIIRSNTQTSKPETRVKDYLREAWGFPIPGVFKWVEGRWDLSSNGYDMAYVTPNFIIHFHLKRIIGKFLLEIHFLIASILIYLQSARCEMFGSCFVLFLLKGKRTQNRRE